MLRCLKLNGRFLRTEIEGGRCSTEGCFRVPPSEYSVSSHLANEYTNVAPRKTSVFRVDNISDITVHYLVWRLRSLVVEAWNTALEVNVTKARALTWFHGQRYRMMYINIQYTYTDTLYGKHIYFFIQRHLAACGGPNDLVALYLMVNLRENHQDTQTFMTCTYKDAYQHPAQQYVASRDVHQHPLVSIYKQYTFVLRDEFFFCFFPRSFR